MGTGKAGQHSSLNHRSPAVEWYNLSPRGDNSFGDATAAHLLSASWDISKVFLVLTLGGTACASIHSTTSICISEGNEKRSSHRDSARIIPQKAPDSSYFKKSGLVCKSGAKTIH